MMGCDETTQPCVFYTQGDIWWSSAHAAMIMVMHTVEIRPADGGADAQGFASELKSAMTRAFSRGGHDYIADGNVIAVESAPHWL